MGRARKTGWTLTAVLLSTTGVVAQEAPKPAGSQLPDVEVIQKKAPQAAPSQKKAPVAKKAPAPSPQPVAEPDVVEADPAPAAGQRGADGRVISNATSTSPVNPSSGVLPTDVQNFAGAASRVDASDLAEQRPLTNQEALVRVPGVVTVTDDGLARHGGIGIRGSNFRRSRKVLVMEDGQSVNYTSFIDPSTHYTPPMERVENIEVVRGTIVSHGPLNNHGVVNFQNLNPFGPTETVISGSINWAEHALDNTGNSRHVHTRQSLGNVGVVASYSGAEGTGAWDNERLSYNDFYGALGMRGSMQDLTISGNYFRQRDDYDEDNFVGTREAFFANGWDKTGAQEDGRTEFNTFNADYWRLQLAHNLYFTDDITLSTRVYGSDHERNRFSSREAPLGEPDGHMRGRNRRFEVFGADSRIEFANVPLFAGLTQDIQAGVRYEYQKHRRCTAFGLEGEKLDADNTGNCYASTANGYLDDAEVDVFKASAFAAFVQSAMHLTPNFTVTPGVRFETYDVERNMVFRGDGDPLTSDESGIDKVLPAVALAWEIMPRTTVYGGYHRGIGPHNVAEGGFPILADIGDNFQLGLRSTAMPGLSFDIAYFHSMIEDYQIKEGYTAQNGNSIYGVLDEASFSGVELGMRADSRPLTGGPWNLFGEATYTYTDGKIEKGEDAIFEDFDTVDVSGNDVPFTIKHFASLTAGVAYAKLWDASMTWTFRGAYFSNPQNSGPLTCIDENGDVDVGCTDANGAGLDELIGGKVDSVWLLSARANYYVNDKLSLFVSGHNLADELYIADVQDGTKPGQGRTITTGFKLKFD